MPGCDLSMSSSRSRQHAVAAVGRYGRVGIDVETLVPRRERLWYRALSSSEIRSVLAAPLGEREAVFYHLWTVKEACGKALGVPLSALRTMQAQESTCGRCDGSTWYRLEGWPDAALTIAISGYPRPAPSMLACLRQFDDIFLETGTRAPL